ncbi:hypothetical protein BFP75_19395 [Maribacter sp. 4G9]|nr:hypothetical protein BFP75_19395 [Maribacter sp. 4G9]
MLNSTKKETDFERTKRYFLEIKNSIPKFTDNLELISQNVDLLNNKDIQSAINYLIVGFRLSELDLDEIRKNWDYLIKCVNKKIAGACPRYFFNFKFSHHYEERGIIRRQFF